MSNDTAIFLCFIHGRTLQNGHIMGKSCYYQIVRDLILQHLASGELSPGDKLPSERTLCAELSLNRNTIRHALLKLQRDGKIFRLERKGWYVNPIRMVYNPANHINFAQLAASQGRKARWTTEDKGIITINEETDAYRLFGPKLGIILDDGKDYKEVVNFLQELKVQYENQEFDIKTTIAVSIGEANKILEKSFYALSSAKISNDKLYIFD